METGHSDTTTQGIRVRVAAQIQADQSDADRRHFVYAYRVVITNEGTERAKLMRRQDGREFEALIGRFFLAPNVAPLTSLTDA